MSASSQAKAAQDAEAFANNVLGRLDVYSNIVTSEEPYKGGVKIGTFTGGDGCYRELCTVTPTTSTECNAAIAREMVRRIESFPELLHNLRILAEEDSQCASDWVQKKKAARAAIAKAEDRA